MRVSRNRKRMRSKITARPQIAHNLRRKLLSRNACRKSKSRRDFRIRETF
jgi:hypothetical protein